MEQGQFNYLYITVYMANKFQDSTHKYTILSSWLYYL